MLSAHIFEEFMIYENDNGGESSEDTCAFPLHNHVDPNDELKKWKYPRKIEVDNDGNELLYSWSKCTNQLFSIETKYNYHSEVTDRPIRSHMSMKQAVISDIEPSFWCEVYFSEYGICKMFIDKNGSLYLIEGNENIKIIVGDLKFLEIIPLSKGAILIGFQENRTSLVYRAILDHPLEEPKEIFIEGYTDSSNDNITPSNIRIIWGTREHPFVFGYNSVEKHHLLLKYSYSIGPISSILSLKLIWMEKTNNNSMAKTVFFERTILEDKYYLVFHVPAKEELNFVGFPVNMFKNICANHVFQYDASLITLNTLSNIKSVVHMDFGGSKSRYVRVSSLLGFNFESSEDIFVNDIEKISTFSIVLSSSGMTSLYFGFIFIANINVIEEKGDKLEVIDISSGISENFDMVALVSNSELDNRKIKKGFRCNIKIVSDDLLIQIIIRFLIKVTSHSFSIYLLRRTFECDFNLQWKTLCSIILGTDVASNDLKENHKVFIKNEKIMGSPLSNSEYKRIRPFQDINKAILSNKSVHFQNLLSFWREHLKNRIDSPFNRKEFCSFISKGLIPSELTNPEMQENENLQNGDSLYLNVNKELLFLFHCIFEELSLLPLLNVSGCMTSRLKDDILLPISKMLGLQVYQEYYQSLDLKYNIISAEGSGKKLDEWETPPILFDKISAILTLKELDKTDNYYLLIKKYFPLQKFTLNLYEIFAKKLDRLKILRMLSSSGISRTIIPLLNPILSFPIEKFLFDFSNGDSNLNLTDKEYCLIERFDLLSSESVFEEPTINFNIIKNPKKKSYVNVPATALPHGRNSVDDQKNMLENIHSYYKGKVDKTKKYNSDRETIAEKWRLYLSEYSNTRPSDFLYNWFFKVFSYDTRLCEALELLSLQIPPQILLQRSSGAYPIDDESWDEFQRQRIIDAIQILYTNFLGRISCTFGSHSLDINLSKLTRPKIVSKVYEIASNTLLSVDFERFKELYFEISLWNDFYIGILEAMKFSLSCEYSNELEQDSKRKSWLFEQIKTFSSPDDSHFLSGFIFGISLNGFMKSRNNKSLNSYPIILEQTEIYRILQNDGHSIKTCSILLGTAISALKTQNKLLFRLYLIHIPNILPNVYANSLQISNFNQYSAILSIGLLFAQTKNAQVAEILISEFLRSISETDDQSSINPFMYSISVAISLGMVIQKGDNIEKDPSNIFFLGNNITEILMSCILVDKMPTFSCNIESSPNLENYIYYSGLKRFRTGNELIKSIQNEIFDNENYLEDNRTMNSENNKFSNSSKHFYTKKIDRTILRVPAILALTIIYLRSKNSYISNSIPIPYDKPDELINYRPETLIFMAMSKIVVEWDDECIPDYEYIRNKIPKYLWYLPPDRTFPFPILEKELDEVYSESKIDERLVNLINTGELDWIHCIQARIAILCGIIWGIGIVFSGKRIKGLKTVISTVLRYIDIIPPIQMPLCLAAAIRDKTICSLQVTIDKWSKDLGIRVCLTSLSVIFSGDGDKDILELIKYFRSQLLESSQFQWTSSTAISPYSAFSVPPIENVYSQLMAYNNALGFLFLSSGHLSFSNDDKLSSTFLLLATHPFYPKDASDIHTPGIIFQPLRYLFISSLKTGRRVIVPKLVKKLPELQNIDEKYKGIAYKEVKYLPIKVELKPNMKFKKVNREYLILPSVLPDWKEIKSIALMGTNYYPLTIDLENDKNSPQVKRLLKGKLWVKLKEGCSGYSWNEAKHIIKAANFSVYPEGFQSMSADISVIKQIFFLYSPEKYREGVPKNPPDDEINLLFDKFSSTLVINDSYKSLKQTEIPNKTAKKGRIKLLVHNYIDQINMDLDTLLKDMSGYHDLKISPHIIKILRITYLIDKNDKVKEIFNKLNKIFSSRMNILINHIRLYYEKQSSTRSLSNNECKTLGVFLELNGMPQTSCFSLIVYNKIIRDHRIDYLLTEDYKNNEEIISPILKSEFPMITPLGLKILKAMIFDSYYRNRTQDS